MEMEEKELKPELFAQLPSSRPAHEGPEHLLSSDPKRRLGHDC